MSEQFADAYRSATAAPAGAGMIAVQLSVACAAVLPVAAAGISVFSQDFRVPIGASEPAATAAERLQFTTGQGPCLYAHGTGRPVLADEAELADRWPTFHEQLIALTPYRAVASVPLTEGLAGIGAMDLYFRRPDQLSGLLLADVQVVAGLIAHTLIRQEWRPTMGGNREPGWLGAPTARERNLVSVAMGMLTVESGIDFADALAVLRAHAYATDRTLDAVARCLVNRSLPIEDLAINQNR